MIGGRSGTLVHVSPWSRETYSATISVSRDRTLARITSVPVAAWIRKTLYRESGRLPAGAAVEGPEDPILRGGEGHVPGDCDIGNVPDVRRAVGGPGVVLRGRDGGENTQKTRRECQERSCGFHDVLHRFPCTPRVLQGQTGFESEEDQDSESGRADGPKPERWRCQSSSRFMVRALFLDVVPSTGKCRHLPYSSELFVHPGAPAQHEVKIDGGVRRNSHCLRFRAAIPRLRADLELSRREAAELIRACKP